jgi:hypothetical protein
VFGGGVGLSWNMSPPVRVPQAWPGGAGGAAGGVKRGGRDVKVSQVYTER